MTQSNGNVFNDLGIGAPDAENLKLRSQLMIDPFSIDVLVKLLAKAGRQVELKVRRHVA